MPAHLAQLSTEPQYLISRDLKELEQEAMAGRAPEPAKTPDIYRPPSSPAKAADSLDRHQVGAFEQMSDGRRTLESKKVNDTFKT